MTVAIGTAGWSIPTGLAQAFPEGASHLARYSQLVSAVEINSSFHRPHRFATYQRWADTVPTGFRFSVKLPKAITHTHRLVDTEALVDAFAYQAIGLDNKLEVVLVQLPPSLVFDDSVATRFFRQLSSRLNVAFACEPRHASWFGLEANHCLVENRIARVAADPAVTPGAGNPGGWSGFTYTRLHGAPQIYRSPYDNGAIRALAETIQVGAVKRQWCIFDNTASGAALANALDLKSVLAALVATK